MEPENFDAPIPLTAEKRKLRDIYSRRMGGKIMSKTKGNPIMITAQSCIFVVVVVVLVKKNAEKLLILS